MKTKDSYTPAEVAMMMEAYHSLYVNGDADIKEFRRYESFVPENVREGVEKLRDIIFGFSRKTAEQKAAIKKDWEAWTTGSEKFSDFSDFFLS